MNFWDPDIWLPPNVTWSHFENDTRFAAFRFVPLFTYIVLTKNGHGLSFQKRFYDYFSDLFLAELSTLCL